MVEQIKDEKIQELGAMSIPGKYVVDLEKKKIH